MALLPPLAEALPAGALLPPPIGLIPVQTSKEARFKLNQFAAFQGYAITVSHSNAWSVHLHCDRSGLPPKPKDPLVGKPAKRSRASRRCGCHFAAYLAKVGGGWLFTVKEGTHSGHIASEPATHPIHRRNQLEGLQAQVINLFMLHRTTLEVICILRKEGAWSERVDDKSCADLVDPYEARILLNTQDLRNLRCRARKRFLKGCSPTAALLLGLDGWRIRRKEAEGLPRRLQHVFCVSLSGLDLLARYPSLLWIDATYKTNRFKMPMVDIVGRAANGGTFYVGCAFVSDEEDSYRWVLGELRGILHSRSIPLPTTVFSDDADSLLAALAAELPETRALLCIWHIQKNIEKRLRLMITQHLLVYLEMEGDIRKEINAKWKAAKQLFNQVIFAPTIAKMETAWGSFKEEFKHEVFAEAIRYITDQWMQDGMRQRFLRCYTNQALHFAETSSSRVEGAHAYIKRFTRVSIGDLLSVMLAIRTGVSTRHIAINQAIGEDRQKLPDNLLRPLFRLVLGWVAPHALQLVARQLAAYQRGETKLADCTHYHRQALGLPCIHEILAVVEADAPLARSQFHRQWWLLTSQKDDYQPLCLEEVLRINDPINATAAGRPRGGANHARKDPNIVAAKEAANATARQATPRRSTRLSRSTKRDPSAFETVRKHTDRIARAAAKDLVKKGAAKASAKEKGAAKKDWVEKGAKRGRKAR